MLVQALIVLPQSHHVSYAKYPNSRALTLLAVMVDDQPNFSADLTNVELALTMDDRQFLALEHYKVALQKAH